MFIGQGETGGETALPPEEGPVEGVNKVSHGTKQETERDMFPRDAVRVWPRLQVRSHPRRDRHLRTREPQAACQHVWQEKSQISQQSGQEKVQVEIQMQMETELQLLPQ